MRVIRTILIVIFALLFVASAGLLAYGIINPPAKHTLETTEAGAEPDLSLFDGSDGSERIDVKKIVTDKSVDPEKKATDLMLQTAYNLINIKQFYFSARVDVKAGDSTAFSDYNYTKGGLNTFKKALAYTGSLNTLVIRCYYVDQKLETKGTSDYDFDAKEWSYAVSKPTTKSADLSKAAATPYYYYSTMDFPLDFGGTKRANDDDTSPRSEDVDYSVIDPDSVEIEDYEEEGLYVLTFKALTSKLNASEEMKYRLSDTTTGGRMSDIRFDEFTVKAEIWKSTGVFRTLTYDAKVRASLNGDSGDTTIKKVMAFSYDDENCSVARKIMGVTDAKGATVYYNALNAANKSKCDSEIAALDAKKAESATADKKEESDD